MTALQQQARALGDPTRCRIFTYLATAESSVDVAQLTEHFGLNHNTIRQHLAKLVDAGLVIESKHSSGTPGRPKLVYAVEPTAESRWGVVGPYRRLSKLLAEIIRTGDSPEEVGRREGARLRTEGTPVSGGRRLNERWRARASSPTRSTETDGSTSSCRTARSRRQRSTTPTPSALSASGYASYDDGRILAAHERVHAEQRFEAELFDRWYRLFVESVDAGWSGPYADRAKRHAAHMAGVISRRLTGEELGISTDRVPTC